MMEMAREPDTFKYIKKLSIMTEQEYAQFLQTKLEQIRDKTGFHWAIWLKDSSRTFIGAVNLNPVASTPMMQIGCQLKRDYWHQGFASELTKRILDFGINELGLKAVYGVFEKENGTSRRLLEKLGFVWQETKSSQGVDVEIHKYPAS
jgi:RimJ/RimL family protein N-acetyltransferase